MAEWKIGEIRQVNGEWYQCMKGNTCNDCAFYRSSCGSLNGKGSCRYNYRKDATNVIFKKLNKVGKPYEHYEKFYQCYKLPMETEIRLLPNNCNPIGKDNLVEIEIKQNQENMEEYRMHDAKEEIPEFDKVVDECLFGEDKLNLKLFDLEAAKAGKPVCTRDGRKARIIFFDRKVDTPIVALIEHADGSEILQCYFNNGKCCHNETSDYDLMMLPVKKEGWVNIYRSQIYDTLERAKEAYKRTCNDDNYLQTIKIEWEEKWERSYF